MDDPAAKVKQLSDSLQNQQSKVSKKKEEVEALNKSASNLDKEIYELRQVVAELEGAKEYRKDSLARAKEEVKKKIEHANRILNSDKDSLNIEKEELLAKLAKLQTDTQKLQNQKNDLLKTTKGEVPREESKTVNEEDLRREEEENAPMEALISKVKVEKEPTGFLTVGSITKIVDICIIIAGRRFRDLTYENRQKMRAVKNWDLEAFLKQTGKDVSQHTEVYKDIEKQVLEGFGLDKSVLDKSIEYYMSIGNLEVVALMNLLGEKLKSFIRSTKDLDRETFKEIMKYKIEFTEKEGENIFGEDNRRKIIQTQLASVSGTYQQKEELSINMLRGYYEYRISSAIAEKFGAEEEDLRAASMKPEIQYDTEIAELMMKGEEALFKCFPRPPQPEKK